MFLKFKSVSSLLFALSKYKAIKDFLFDVSFSLLIGRYVLEQLFQYFSI